MTVVIFIWWLTNRLTHECCVDGNPAAGDIGILTGTALSFRKAFAEGTRNETGKRESLFARRKKPDSSIVYNTVEAYDPHEWNKADGKTPEPVADPLGTKRMPKRHPGISIFYFSAPVMFIFAIGLRVVQHGGEPMIRAGHFYMGCYTVAALSLLMLSSLAGLREYFRARKTYIPPGIGPFWIVLGSVMIVMVLVGALTLPMPERPPIAIVTDHQTDFWTRTSTFEPLPVVATAAEEIEQSRFIEYLSRGVLVLFGLLFLYALLRGVGHLALAAARRRRHLPSWFVKFFVRLDRFLQRITNLPNLPTFEPRRRVPRAGAQSARFRNPMGNVDRMPTPQQAIEVSYQALCALAADLGVPRLPDQTPYEFIDRFPKELKSLREEAAELTNLYVAAAYSRAEFDERILDRVRKFWVQYERTRRRVLH